MEVHCLSPELSVNHWERVLCLIFSSHSLNYGGVCLASDAQFSDFLGSMGPAQFVGRQTLATTPMGECPKVSNGLGEVGGHTGSPASLPPSPLPVDPSSAHAT